MTFLEGYGTKLDRELGTTDRTQRFTTVLRKEYFNEGVQKFNEQTGCFIRRFPIPLVDGTQEYDLESSSIITNDDYLRPSKTSASLRRYDGSGSANTDYTYVEGPDLPYKSEEELNQTEPGWRGHAAATPTCWFLREDGGSEYIGLHPAPDVPSAETWTLYWPYVAKPPTLTADGDIPYSISANPRTKLVPYHEGILYYAAAQCELLRKNYEQHEWQMRRFAAVVAQYRADQAPPRGSRIRLRTNWFRSVRTARPLDPTRFQNS